MPAHQIVARGRAGPLRRTRTRQGAAWGVLLSAMMRTVGLLGFGLLASGLLVVGLGPAEVRADDRTVVGKAKVLSGDTLVVGAIQVKLFGIVAPGANQKCRDGALPWLCGAASAQYLRELVSEKAVSCAVDPRGVGRCVVGDTDLSRDMVREGWAVPGKEGIELYGGDERSARRAKRGLWRADAS